MAQPYIAHCIVVSLLYEIKIPSFCVSRPRLSIRLSVCVAVSVTKTVCPTSIKHDTEFLYKKRKVV